MRSGFAAMLLLCFGLTACAMPTVEQRAGPFSQSVGPGGVQQSAGPFSQSVGPGGVRQGTAPPASASGQGRCEAQCGGNRYTATCPVGETPVCQCTIAPYASCSTRTR